MFTGILRYGS